MFVLMRIKLKTTAFLALRTKSNLLLMQQLFLRHQSIIQNFLPKVDKNRAFNYRWDNSFLGSYFVSWSLSIGQSFLSNLQ